MDSNFWQVKPLSELSHTEWESLCDGCGKCCLHKLEDYETGEVHYTRIGCWLLDINSCRCSDYPNRKKKVTNCIQLTPDSIKAFQWLPPTCAYRMIAEGKDLPDWHPLLSGQKDSVHKARKSVKTLAFSALHIHESEMEDYIIPTQFIS